MPNIPGSEHLAVIKVVGVGGGGTNAVNRMVEAGVRGVEFIAVNTDRQALLMSDADKTIHIGEELSATPRWAARPPRRAVRRFARRWPRPTWSSSPPARAAAGTGAAPIVAEIAREEIGALTVGVVASPSPSRGAFAATKPTRASICSPEGRHPHRHPQRPPA